MKQIHSRKFCVAPMMGYTTPYARKLYRILSKNTFLFTEMIATKTLINSKKRDLIIENEDHNPVALQVGGSNLNDLKKSSRIANEYNYDEINLNVGCPSKAVQKGSFGACLMQDKKLVRQCLESLQNKHIETSMKCRIGLGKNFNYDYFEEFIDEVLKSGIKIIYVHARNAILGGISPKANRTIPPLNYEFVNKIKTKYPKITFILNGGIDSFDKAINLSENYDGIMLGRLVQNNPFLLKRIDEVFYGGNDNVESDEKIISSYFNYIRPKLGQETIFRLLSPILNIFFGIPNSKKFRIKINYYLKNNNLDLIEDQFMKFVVDQKFVGN